MPNGNNTAAAEESRALALAEARFAAETEAETQAESDEGETEESAGSGGEAAAHISPFAAGAMLTLAIANDALDYFVIGSIPLVGDVLDGLLWGILVLWVYFAGLERPPFWGMAGGVEIIPFGDLIPTFTLMVLLLIRYNQRSR